MSLVQPLSEAGRDRAIASLVLSFAADPVMRWMYPEPDRYLAAFPGFVQRLTGPAFEQGTAYALAEQPAVALCLAPGVHADPEPLGAWMLETIDPQRHDTIFALAEQLGAAHPEAPHWYLPVLGVEPGVQGRGYGSTLLEHLTRECDRTGTIAYLESSSPRNVPLYERHGFVVSDELRVNDAPPLWPMVREPR